MFNRIVCYDYETSCTDLAFGQPLQFASVTVDYAFNEIDTANILVRPRIDVVPHPQAYLTHHLSPRELHEVGCDEMTAARQIQRIFRASEATLIMGYNSQRFDDEVTRRLFFRNLLDPYEHEYKADNRRADFYHIIQMARVFRPDLIAWPEPRTAGAEPSLKLADIAAANGFDASAAHDALADVRMVLQVAALLRERNPKLWAYCTEVLTSKDEVRSLLRRREPLIHVSSTYGSDRRYASVILPLIEDPNVKNRVICADLTRDPSDMLQMDPDQLRHYLWTRKDELEKGSPEVPLLALQFNKAPAIVRSSQMLTPGLVDRHGWDLDQINANARTLTEDDPFRRRAAQVFQSNFPPARHAIASIYDGFLSNDDRGQLNRLLQRADDVNPRALRIHHADAFKEADAARDTARVFELTLHAKYTNLLADYQDPSSLAKRLARLSEAPGFSPSELIAYAQYLDERLHDPRSGAALTASVFDEALSEAVMKTTDSEDCRLLEEVREDMQDRQTAVAVLCDVAETLLDAARREREARPEITRVLEALASRRDEAFDPDSRVKKRAREGMDPLEMD